MKMAASLRWSIRNALSVWVLVFVSTAYAQVSLDDFQVTNGKIENAPRGGLMVSIKEMRAVLKHPMPQNVIVKFTCLGPTAEVSRLGSGEVRSQFGIKLRAQDNCSLVYVMWHLVPDQKIAVSAKRNPAESTHQQCIDHGYINKFKPRQSAPAAAVRPNQPHKLAASMKGSDLTVVADDRIVWQGDLGPVALAFDGPVGLRSDNAQVAFDFFVTK